MRTPLFLAMALLGTLSLMAQAPITLHSGKLTLTLETNQKAVITALTINGQSVIENPEGAYTSITANGTTYSSLHTRTTPTTKQKGDTLIVDNIIYGDEKSSINESQNSIKERWLFITANNTIRWKIERNLPYTIQVDNEATPNFTFDQMNTWTGAYQGYGGIAWFYLFNEPLCTYGVHTNLSSFWNSETGNGLDVQIDANKQNVAMRYTRAADNKLSYGITVSDKPQIPRYDSGTHRRRFIRGKTDVWAPFAQQQGKTEQWITLRYFDVNERYGRGRFVGLDGSKISAVLNTIARMGVIDSLHFGGNSWHTPYGPICLHEQYIAQFGLAIDDPHYLKGYQSCLDFYRDHAIKPDGRVFPRWAYTDEDMMPNEGNADGFYEAQWGFLLDANPDFVSNVADLYDLTGNRHWVQTQQRACEKALDWILARDSDGNGLVEMMTDNEKQKRSSDWIDIIWASYENAFVNAKLYHALLKWSDIERQLANPAKADKYATLAAKLKTAFNKPTTQGGFWDEQNHCYIHWRDKDGSAHGRNMVTPVNFMAIAYGICDDTVRTRHILDTIETEMEKEHLFFWPLCMSTYAPGEGNDWQFPFPNYENGDLFLSWGSIAVKAYAAYRPDLAIKYIRKVLDQYSKDGLAFQRYGRLHQDGLGDDILSGNSLSIVGLYQSIYGINPLYNRLYLEPHLTPELAGSELRYIFHNQRLTIKLDTTTYTIGDDQCRITADQPFGFSHTGNSLNYFDKNDATASLTIISRKPLTLTVSPKEYVISGLQPNTAYSLSIDGRKTKTIKTDATGIARLQQIAGKEIKIE